MSMQAWPRMYEVVNGQIVRRSLGGTDKPINLRAAEDLLQSFMRLARSGDETCRALAKDLESALAVAKSEMEMTDDRT